MTEQGGTASREASRALKASSLGELVKALGVPKSTLHRYSKEPWWPSRGSDGSWSVAEVLKAIEAKDKPATPTNPLIAAAEARRVATALPALTAGELPSGAFEDDEADRAILGKPASPLEGARAAARIAARAVSTARGAGLADALESYKVSLAELRLCEASYLELAQARGELIERDVAVVSMGALSRTFGLALDRLEARLAAQVELWCADTKFREAPPQDRARAVRSWMSAQARTLRTEESNAEARARLDAMIQAELEDRSKG